MPLYTALIEEGSVPDQTKAIIAEEITGLRPASPDGLHTFATQTHPADGCAGAIVATTGQARDMSHGEGVATILSAGFSRARKTHMPEAPVPAARAALPAPSGQGETHYLRLHGRRHVADGHLRVQAGGAAQ